MSRLNNVAWLLGFLDFIALLSLLISEEISYLYFLPPLFLLLLKIPKKSSFSISPFYSILSLIGVFFYAGVLIKSNHLHPLVAAGSVSSWILGLTWISKIPEKNPFIRLGVSFAILLLASSLSPELILGFLIFIYTFFASFLISALFYKKELNAHGYFHLSVSLPPQFLKGHVKKSLFLFLISFLIFPILPRPRSLWGVPQGSWQVGYSEEVDLNSWIEGNLSGSGKILIRAFLNDLAPEEAFPGRLVRMRVLDQFKEGKWLPVQGESHFSSTSGNSKKSDYEFEIIREPLKTSRLPHPIQKATLTPISPPLAHFLSRTNREWLSQNAPYKRIHYKVTLSFEKEKNELDLPTPENLKFPKSLDQPKWETLKNSLFKERTSIPDQLRSLLSFFRNGDFKATLSPKVSASAKNPLEEFLFKHRSAHCEFFASAAALLLRLDGIPSRVVAGFRIAKDSKNGVLTIRDRDAHAWVEAYSEKNGWLTLDPTPFILSEANPVLETLLNAYEELSAYWYRYILTLDQMDTSEIISGVKAFSSDSLQFKSLHSLKSFFSSDFFKLLFLIFTLLGVVLIFWRFLLKKSEIKKSTPTHSLHSDQRTLLKKRREIEKLCLKKKIGPLRNSSDLLALPITTDWVHTYQLLRFSHPTKNRKEKLKAFFKLHKELKKKLKTSKS